MPFSAITDGLSNTILVGEKHIPSANYGVGWWDCSIYNGDYPLCSGRPAGPGFPLARTMSEQNPVLGSYHPGICQFGFGDGRVQSLAVTIDPVVLGLLANCSDGQSCYDY